MKLLIASDIHGSAFFCERLLYRFEKENAGRLLLLGDILYHGPRNDLPENYAPKRVAELLNGYKNKIFCVRGNCDAEVDQLMLKFPIMADYAVITAENRILYATHGHIYNKEKMPPLSGGDILISGHTHIPEHSAEDGMIFINPGSVSIPKNQSPNSYVIFEGREFLWKRLDNGDIFDSYSIK